MDQERNNDIVPIFENLQDNAFLEIQEAAEKGKITKFEEKAFGCFCAAANLIAKTYLTADKLPYKEIKQVENDNTIIDAYIFLCATELHVFFVRLKNKKEIREALDVSREKLIKDFAEIFDGDEVEDYFYKVLGSFDKMAKEVDPRDLWYNQAIFFGNKLSEGKIDFGDLTEKDLTKKLDISLTSQKLQIETAKLFDKIVLSGKK